MKLPGRIYWGEEGADRDHDDEAGDYLFDPATGVYYQNDGALNQDFGCHVLANGDQGWSHETYGGGAEEDAFADLLEMDEAGEVYVCLQEPLPQMLDQAEAVEYASDMMSYVYGETAERWASKGKGKGKRPKGKGKGKGKDLNPAKGAGKNNKGFGIYGTGAGNYADHRRALQEARTNRGFAGTRGEYQRPRTSLQDLKNRSRCHQCHQIGHWSRDCHKVAEPRRCRAPGRILLVRDKAGATMGPPRTCSS